VHRSLHDVDPALGRTVSRFADEALATARLLPVLRLQAGARVPPGADVVAYGVLSGLLTEDTGMLAGPGDVVDADGMRWTACGATELAAVGRAFAERAAVSPEALAALLSRVGAWPAEPVAGGTLEQRLAALLWRLAARWGEPERHGIVLRIAIDADGLARVLRRGPEEVRVALAALDERGAVVGRRGGWWLPSAGGARGDELRARAAVQSALARRLVEDYAAVSTRSGAELRRSWRRRSQRRPEVG
jgi:hypothetical protein